MGFRPYGVRIVLTIPDACESLWDFLYLHRSETMYSFNGLKSAPLLVKVEEFLYICIVLVLIHDTVSPPVVKLAGFLYLCTY